MLDTKNSPCSFHSKIAVPHDSQMLLVYFALVLKNQPLSSGKCERRAASQGNGHRTALTQSRTGSSSRRSHRVTRWAAPGLCSSCGPLSKIPPSLLFRKGHGEEAWEKLWLQLNYYPKDSCLIWYSSCRCAAPVKNLHFSCWTANTRFLALFC